MHIEISQDSDFSIHNLPFGIFSTNHRGKRVGVALGEHVIDLAALYPLAGGLGMAGWDFDPKVLVSDSLNAFIRLGKQKTSSLRRSLQRWLEDALPSCEGAVQALLLRNDVVMHLPIEIGDYTDFYSSIDHATNVGKMFRDPEHALVPNWRHLPVAYHGRSSSIVVSDTPIHRPRGQILPPDATQPIYGSTAQLDFELEMAYVIGRDSTMGKPIHIDDAMDYIFGMVLFNDWSARDIQKWEYVPLGPFLGKNFASSISPWVVTMDALAPFRVSGPLQEPPVLPYLQYQNPNHYDIQLTVDITPREGKVCTVSRSNYKYMYWNMSQQLAHHTANGCNIRVGDLLASGTLSGPTPETCGSLLELSWAGTRPVILSEDIHRTFLEDLDTVTMRGYAQHEDRRVGFGQVTTQILPAIETS